MNVIIKSTNFKQLNICKKNNSAKISKIGLSVYSDENCKNRLGTLNFCKDNNHFIMGPSIGFLRIPGLLSTLKKEGIYKILIDIKNYEDSLFRPQFKNLEDLKEIIEFKQFYESTNNSKMTLIMINLKNIKLEKLK